MIQDFYASLLLDQQTLQELTQSSFLEPKIVELESIKTQKVTTQQYTIYSTIGSRSNNLDRFSMIIQENIKIFGIFDGFGDATVSQILSEKLLNNIHSNHQIAKMGLQENLKKSFYDIQEELLEIQLRKKQQDKNCGSTALVIIIYQEKIIIANVGDCQAYGITSSKTMIALNTVHNLQNYKERKKINQKGGIIIKYGSKYRLNGELTLSRAMGSQKYLKYLNTEPQIHYYQLNKFIGLVLASDGFYTKYQQASDSNYNRLIQQINKIINNQSILQDFDDNATMIYFKIVV